MLLPNTQDSFTDNLQQQKKCFRFIWKRKQVRISRKTAIKSVKKGELGLLDIQQFMNGLKLIWMCRFTNNNQKWKMLKVLGSCLSLDKSKRPIKASLAQCMH